MRKMKTDFHGRGQARLIFLVEKRGLYAARAKHREWITQTTVGKQMVTMKIELLINLTHRSYRGINIKE